MQRAEAARIAICTVYYALVLMNMRADNEGYASAGEIPDTFGWVL